jgi:hypothetical protein
MPRISSEASCLALALEPPGNIARDLAAFKRRLFAELGEASSLFLPEVAPLALARSRSLGALSRSAIDRALGEIWTGMAGAFISGGVIVSQGLLYLELEGPYKALVAEAQKAFVTRAFMPYYGAPLEAGRGFFLGLSSGSESERGIILSPPRISFRDCSLVILGLHFGEPPRMACTWRELARVKRRSGPSPLP